MLGELLNANGLKGEIERTYSRKVRAITKLDSNVHRVDVEDGKSLVVRVYAIDNKPAIESLAALLEYLQQNGFPAERLFSPAISTIESSNACILATEFVSNRHPDRNKTTFYRLGKLLGRLHALPVPDGLSEGGAWHHLSMTGGIEEECHAAANMLRASQPPSDALSDRTTSDSDVNTLISRLEQLPLAFADKDLPKCIVHPDFVPVNIIEEGLPSTSSLVEPSLPRQPAWTVVDWTGAGVGYRILSLGFLLGAAAAKGKLVLVDAVMAGYGEYITLEERELEVLPLAAYARFFTMDCWNVAMGREDATKIVEGIPQFVALGESVVARVRKILKQAV